MICAVASTCQARAPSAESASEMAAAVGFTKLYNLEGGIEAWKKQGLPYDKPAA